MQVQIETVQISQTEIEFVSLPKLPKSKVQDKLMHVIIFAVPNKTRKLCYRKDDRTLHYKTTDHTIQQYAHGLLLESPFVPSSTDCWAVWAKIGQKQPSRLP